MRARDVMLYVICVNIAAPIVLNMGVFSMGPAGTSSEILVFTTIAGAIALLVGGGVSLLLFNFKIPSVLTVYAGMFIGSGTMLATLILQLVSPVEVAIAVDGVLVFLFGIIGVLGAMEIAGGAHGPME